MTGLTTHFPGWITFANLLQTLAVSSSMALFYIFGVRRYQVAPVSQNALPFINYMAEVISIFIFVWIWGDLIVIFIFHLDKRQLGAACGDLLIHRRLLDCHLKKDNFYHMHFIVDGNAIGSVAAFKWFLMIILMINLQFRIDQECFGLSGNKPLNH